MKLVKIFPASLCLLACVAGAQQGSQPNDKTDVYLQNDKPKNQKDSNTRTIQGTVKDSSDNPLPGSIVQLKDMKTSKIVDFITKDDGKYTFSDLPMDINYELAATRGDLKAAAKKVSVYDTRRTVILNFQVAAANP